MPERLLLVFLEDDGGVVATESEGVGEHGSHVTLLGLVECEVEVVINLRIIVALCMVDGRRHDSVGDSLNAEDSLQSAGGTEKVT